MHVEGRGISFTTQYGYPANRAILRLFAQKHACWYIHCSTHFRLLKAANWLSLPTICRLWSVFAVYSEILQGQSCSNSTSRGILIPQQPPAAWHVENYAHNRTGTDSSTGSNGWHYFLCSSDLDVFYVPCPPCLGSSPCKISPLLDGNSGTIPEPVDRNETPISGEVATIFILWSISCLRQ